MAKGVEIVHNAKFISPSFDESGKLTGGVILHDGKECEVHARLTADASGISSVVRTSLPEGYGVENFKIGARDKFFVVLYYIKFNNSEKDRISGSCGWPYYKTWIAPQHDKDGAILGVGANLSYEYAENCFKRFAEKTPFPEHEVMYVEKGCTPYRRPPYSFVADGFIALGDAACLTNPWNGEGITAAWRHARIAAATADRVLKNGETASKAALWEINQRYYKEQGAEFAQNFSLLPAVVGCTPDENDYQFEKSIIFKGDEDKEESNIILDILKGVFAGKLKFSTFTDIVSAANIGGKLYKHYLSYPESESGFDDWVKKADRLWSKTKNMADLAQKVL
jgi:flavin-dependent dehydrogenase